MPSPSRHRSFAEPEFRGLSSMVLVKEYSLPVRILAPCAFPTAVGGVEQQPPVGVTPLLPRSLAIKAISLAGLGIRAVVAREGCRARLSHPAPRTSRLQQTHTSGRPVCRGTYRRAFGHPWHKRHVYSGRKRRLSGGIAGGARSPPPL